MRPPDEPQTGTRNILARLEKQGPQHQRSAGGAGMRLALVGGSGLLVVSLIGTLVALTRQNVSAEHAAEMVTAMQAAPPPAPRQSVPAMVTLPRAPKVEPAAAAPPPPPKPAPKTKRPPVARSVPMVAAARTVKRAQPSAPAPIIPVQAVRAEPPEDSDIALLTAILAQTVRHQPEQEAAACAAAMSQSRKCTEKTTSRP